MQSIAVFLSADHRHCDRLFADAELAVSSGEWESAAARHHDLIERMQRHFAGEEGGLFPAFEQVASAPAGPTEVLRHEHDQMRELFEYID